MDPKWKHVSREERKKKEEEKKKRNSLRATIATFWLQVMAHLSPRKGRRRRRRRETANKAVNLTGETEFDCHFPPSSPPPFSLESVLLLEPRRSKRWSCCRFCTSRLLFPIHSLRFLEKNCEKKDHITFTSPKFRMASKHAIVWYIKCCSLLSL